MKLTAALSHHLTQIGFNPPVGRAISTALIFQRLLSTQVWLAQGQQQAAARGCLQQPRPHSSAAPQGASGQTAQPCAPTARSAWLDLHNVSHIPVCSEACGFWCSPAAGTSALQLCPGCSQGPPAQGLQATRPRALSLAAAAPTLALHAWELHLSPFVRFLSQQSFGNLVLKPAGEGTAAATCASNTTGTGCKDQHQPNHPQR